MPPEEENKLKEEAISRGYVHGNWIISDMWPKTLLQIGHGLIWSEMQNALVIGCKDIDNNYYTAVPIFKDGKWAKLTVKLYSK